MSILSVDRIALNVRVADKLEAIRRAGELLIASGCVLPPYVDGMLAREASMSTSLGNGVAIPHGIYENRDHILQTGLSVLQLAEPIDWDGEEKVFLVVGIAASSDEHMDVLANLAEVVEDEAKLAELRTTADPHVIVKHLGASQHPVA